jgi:hypothetical protein
MEIFISIDGVLRNFIQKFDYHYKDSFFDSEFENENNFEYKITDQIQNNNLLNSYAFQSIEEYEFFLFIEYPIEIFGHAGLSYSNAFTELNKMIFENSEHNFTIIGLNEVGKAKPATLFFLSKNGFLGNNIRFIKNEDIGKCWDQCDMWISDNIDIIQHNKAKTPIKFNTNYNKFFTCKEEISKLSEIKELWSKFSENPTT